jgi:hypothetical protein
MQADYAVELGRDDPALELPWMSKDESLRYLDLKQHPELVDELEEVRLRPELGEFLRRINVPDLPLETAKCDVWFSEELDTEEEIFGASCKFASYVDLVFRQDDLRVSLEKHESFAKALCKLLERAPEMASASELVIRHCHYHTDQDNSVTGFCITAYVTGYGDGQMEACQRWGIALKLVQNAIKQLANSK